MKFVIIMENLNNKTASILKLTERLKENYTFNVYKNIILPFIVLKRLDSLLEFSRENVIFKKMKPRNYIKN